MNTRPAFLLLCAFVCCRFLSFAEQADASLAHVFSPSSEPNPALGVAGPAIRINSVGFLPDAEKRATIAAVSCDSFRVVRVSDGEVVLVGKASAVLHTPVSDTGEVVRIADFSTLTNPGAYRIEADGLASSVPFVIAGDVWNRPLEVVLRGFTLWRCGVAVSAEHEGRVFEHAACHMDDGWLDYANIGKDAHSHVRRDGTGGWHDAGDYNKYVVNAGMSVGIMLHAFEHFSGKFPPAFLRTFLDEMRWELEWLFKMQADDGRVFHKLSQLDFNFWGMPELDARPRFFSGWSTVATADFAAVMALAQRVYAKIDASFATRCGNAALLSWKALLKFPDAVEPDQKAFGTGPYTAKDFSHRLWAAAELWESSGDNVFLSFFEKHVGGSPEFDFAGPSWGDARGLAFGVYLRSSRHDARDASLVRKLSDNLFSITARIISNANESGYGRPFGWERKSCFWGANGNVAAQTYLLHLADFLRPDPRNRQAAQHALAFLFGRNFHGRSYVTGLGAYPPLHPHDRRGEPAWPGYLVGGGWPNGRAWVDEAADFRQNEIAINWNASLVYALAAFVR